MEDVYITVQMNSQGVKGAKGVRGPKGYKGQKVLTYKGH